MQHMTDRLGFYLVGWKKFYNKTLALIESHASGYDIKWVFNEHAYKSIDWSIPIETPLLELYRKRAQQLRDNYDYLILYFSGGADSGNVLHAFLENNIFIDEIVMQLPEIVKPTLNSKDTSNKNYYSEIEYSAIPLLNKFKNKIHPNTKVRYQDFAKTGLEVLEKEDWFDDNPLCVSISVSGILRQITQVKDKYVLNLHNTGKSIALILGVDKPLVYFDGTDYYCYFMDTSTYHYVTPVDFNETKSIETKNYSTEFFYWTPDMPEIIIKQAQEIKRNCELNPYAKFMASQTLTRPISDYRDVLHPVIYPPEVTVDFQTEKPTTKIIRPMDDWFWATASERVKGNYLNTIKYLESKTNPQHMIKNNIQNGVSASLTGFYKL